MADNDQNNDEYKFAELDSMDNGLMGEGDGLNNPVGADTRPEMQKKDVRRNAIVVVIMIVFAFLAYKLIGALFFSKSQPVTPAATPVIPVVQPITPTEPVQPVPVVDTGLQQRVSAIDNAQQNLTSSVNALSEKINTMSDTVNTMNSQISQLNQTVSQLSTQMAKQADEINVLMLRTQPKRSHPVNRRAAIQYINYYIQAVIPGRAWLIGSNGSTLTVREGTTIPGYGMVKLIDSIQGRVLTSSGKVIKFSQEDS